MSEHIEATVQRTFLHDNKTVRRGDTITGTKAVIHQLTTRGLVAPLAGASAEAPQTPTTIAILERNAPEILAWAADATNRDQLQAALAAERDGKARKGVIEALEKALAD